MQGEARVALEVAGRPSSPPLRSGGVGLSELGALERAAPGDPDDADPILWEQQRRWALPRVDGGTD